MLSIFNCLCALQAGEGEKMIFWPPSCSQDAQRTQGKVPGKGGTKHPLWAALGWPLLLLAEVRRAGM